MPVRLGSALVAEFVGSFALTFIGIMAIHHAGLGAGLLSVALAHGIILAVVVSASMPTSGGHLNPAVTVGFLVTGKIKPVAAISYIVLQLLGGIVAALAVYALFGGGTEAVKIVAAARLNPDGISNGAALLSEIIATFLLVFVIWGTAADPRARNVGGFAIGLTIAADILAVGPISGASMNPQRSLGPTLIASLTEGGPGASFWSTHWIYWVGPIVGAVLAAVIYQLALWPSDPKRGIDPGAVDVPPTQRPQ